MKRAIIGVLIVAAIGAGAGAYYIRRGGPEVSVNTAPITRGDIVDTVGATGTLQAVTTVQVGSQVSGNISWLGADFNSIVKKGQVIAKLDPSLFEAQLEQSRASVNQQRANLVKAQSDLERAKVQLLDAQQKYTRSKELAARSLVPQSDLDAAKIAVDSAQASLQSQQATVAQVQAAIAQAQATLNQNQVNVDHTIITAPIDGIVTQRSVDVGQTVAASMQAPTLFVIAADLTKMQVNANIDEADVGRIRPGQHVTFRVDAYPTDAFDGTVTQIRLQPVVQSNVTTYGTIISVPNTELKLKPGMTANLKVEVAKRTDVLRVPNTAIRFRPTQDVFAALNQPVPPEAQPGRGGRGGGRAQGAFGRNGGNGANTQNAAAAATAPAPPATNTPPAAGGVRTGGTAADSRTGQNARAAQAASSGPNVDGAAPAGASGGDNGGRRRGFAGRGGNAAGGGDQAAAGQGEGGGGRGFGGRGGFGRGGDPAQMMERFKGMAPDQQQQFIARMKDRGVDTSAFEAAIAKPAAKAPASTRASSLIQPKYGKTQGAETIDALFPALPTIETRGRVWLFIDKQLKAVNVRLGVTDGSNTELIGGDLQPNMEVVTGVTGVGSTRPQVGGAGTGNPFQQNQRGGFGGPPGGGRGR